MREPLFALRKLTAARSSSGIGLILLAYLALATAYSVAVPLGEAPDEVSHYAYTRVLARAHHLPAPEGMAFGETFQPPLYYATAALTNFWVPEGAFTPQANADFDVDDPAAPPNLLLHPRQEEFPYHDGALAWHLARLCSVLLGAATVWATYQLAILLFPTRRLLAGVTAGFVAFLPEFLFLSGAVNNDNLGTALSSLLLWQLARLVVGQPQRRDYAIIGLLLGLGILTKTSLWTFVPVAFGVILWRLRRDGPAPLLLVSGAAALVAGPWLIRNMMAFGDPLGWSATRLVTDPRVASLTRDDYVGLASGLFVTFWGAFGGAGHLLLPRWTLSVLLLLSVFAVAGLARRFWRGLWQREGARGSRQVVFMVLVAHLATVLIAFWFWSRSVLGTGQGRLLFPALPTLALFFVVGLTTWLPKNRGPGWMTTLLAALFLFGASTLLFVIRPLYAHAPSRTAAAMPAQPRQADFRFGDGLRLVGYEWPTTVDDRIAPGTTITLTLMWRADSDLEQDERLVLRLVDRRGQPSWVKEGSPSAGWDTTDRWRAGDVVIARHKVVVPLDAPSGWTRLLAGVRPAGSEAWRRVRNEEGKLLGDTVMLGQMTVKK